MSENKRKLRKMIRKDIKEGKSAVWALLALQAEFMEGNHFMSSIISEELEIYIRSIGEKLSKEYEKAYENYKKREEKNKK